MLSAPYLAPVAARDQAQSKRHLGCARQTVTKWQDEADDRDSKDAVGVHLEGTTGLAAVHAAR